jgi:hypothetical protein
VRTGRDVVELEALAALEAEDAGDAGPSGQAAGESRPTERRVVIDFGVTSRRKPLESGQEALGGRRRGGLREDVLQSALCVGLRLALGAGGQMREDALTRLMTELAVHQGGESVSQVLFREASLAGFGP